MTIQEALRKFESHLRGAGKSPASIYSYGNILAKLPQDMKVGEISPHHLIKWTDRPDVSPRTRNSIRVALKSFCRFLTEMEYIEKNPAESLKLTFCPPEPRAYLKGGELQTFLSVLPDNHEGTLFNLYVRTGIRLGEALGIRRRDVGEDSIVIHGKGGKKRTVFLDDFLKRKISVMIQDKGPDDLLFRISRQNVNSKLKKFLSLAGLPAMSPHSLRRSFLTLLYERTKDVVLTSRAAGHSSVRTTQIYLQINDESVKDAVVGLFGERKSPSPGFSQGIQASL